VIRDILNAVQAKFAETAPSGTSSVSHSGSGTGVLTLDASSIHVGHWLVIVQVVVPGAPGTAQVQISLDNGNNYDSPVLVPVGGNLPVNLPEMASGFPSSVPSGLVLSFSGSFVAGDSYSFTDFPTVLFLFGEENLASQDASFPRVLWIPVSDDFSGTEDYAQGRDQRTQQRSIVSAKALFEAHCWGIDYDRTEVLRDLVMNALRFSLGANNVFLGGEWPPKGNGMSKAGRFYVLKWRVPKPVLQFAMDTIPVAPPFTIGQFNTSQDPIPS
jgi:hypothetical protein